jgi:hypothetical protein
MGRKTILIFNSQATGDCLIGTHAARFIKQAYPDSHIIFCVRQNLTLTTAENNKNGIFEVLEILELQEHIDDVGFIDFQGNVNTKNNSLTSSPDIIYQQHGWFSDLGVVKSALTEIAEEIGWNNIHTETKFSVGEEAHKYSQFTVATAGPLDWNRKLNKNLDYGKIFNYLRSLIPDVRIIPLGRDVSDSSYLTSLRELNKCHMYLGPMGSMTAMAAGLGIDTINICSVFPPTFDSPEFYHSGNHHSVTAKEDKHCGTYACIKPAFYKKEYSKTKIGNPETEYPFWTNTCGYREDKKSCVINITEDDIIEKIDKWFKQLHSKIK